MPTVPASACVGEYIAGHRGKAERIVEFPAREQAGRSLSLCPAAEAVRSMAFRPSPILM
jgi:hypothetical protein